MGCIGMTCDAHARRVQGIGTELKPDCKVSSAYHALYIGLREDAIIDWMGEKMDELYPDLTKGHAHISVSGVCFYLHDHSVFVALPDSSLVLVHKKRFKRHLKKAICANRTRS